MNKTYTLALSRWHKVAERLARECTETIGTVRAAYTNTTVTAWLGESQEDDLRAQSRQAEERLEWALRLQDSIAAVRKGLGNANASEGVTADLADHDRLSRRLKVLTDLLAEQSSEMVGIDQLKNLPARLAADSEHFYSRQGIQVRLMDRKTLNKLSEQAEAVRVEYYALSDRINEKNRANLTLTLPSDIARAAGL